MTSIRSRAVKEEVNIKAIIKKVLKIAIPTLIGIAVLLIIGSKYYEAQVLKCLDMIDNMREADGFSVIGTSRKVVKATTDENGELKHVAAEVPDDSNKGTISVNLFFKDDICYIDVQNISTKEQREDFGGKTWVSIEKSKLYKSGLFKASDILKCIDTDLYRKELKDSMIISKGIKGIKYFLFGKTSDTYGTLNASEIVISDVEKFNSNLESYYIDIVGDYKSDLNGAIGYVSIGNGYANVGGKGSTGIKIEEISRGSEFSSLSDNIEMMSVPIESIGSWRYDKFTSGYKSKSLIVSLKGAFEE